jgi:uncharacterized membrane-anchored protein YitT (DUF2179 family)
MFSYRHLKEAVYVMQVLLGVSLITASVFLFNNTSLATEPICYIVPGTILMIVGLSCVFFGVETYLLRDDPDIWR